MEHKIRHGKSKSLQIRLQSKIGTHGKQERSNSYSQPHSTPLPPPSQKTDDYRQGSNDKTDVGIIIPISDKSGHIEGETMSSFQRILRVTASIQAKHWGNRTQECQTEDNQGSEAQGKKAKAEEGQAQSSAYEVAG